MNVCRIRILVVDDAADAADTTVELLSLWGYDAVACYSGADGLKAACLYRPAIVLLDLAMPQLNGFQFAGLFHEMPGCESVPIIAVSGHSSPAYQASAREAGISHYLVKPVDPRCLEHLLARELEVARTPAPLLEPLACTCGGIREVQEDTREFTLPALDRNLF